jgi:hypothetical protein
MAYQLLRLGLAVHEDCGHTASHESYDVCGLPRDGIPAGEESAETVSTVPDSEYRL